MNQTVKYIIPKMTDFELMSVFLEKINNNENLTKTYTNFISEFKLVKSNFNLIKNSTVANSISRTYNFLKNIDVIKEDDKGNLSINEIYIDENDLINSFEKYLNKYFQDIIKKENLLTNGEVDKVKVKEFTKYILNNREGKIKDPKDSTISRDSAYFFSFLDSLNKNDVRSSKIHKPIIEKYKLTSDKQKLDLARDIIIKNANIHDSAIQDDKNIKTKINAIKTEILTDEFLDTAINKNYNSNIDLFLEDIQHNELIEPDYVKIINNFDSATKKILEYLMNGWNIVVLTDSDNDGSSALVAANRMAKYLHEKKYKFRADFARVIKGSVVNHGPNFSHLEEMRKNNVFKKDENVLFITADAFINSDPEKELILKNYPKSEIIVTDHHSPKDEIKTIENDRTIIVNYLHESDIDKMQGFGISGGHTFNLLMSEVLKELPDDEQKEYLIQQFDSLSKLANYMDMVHAHPASRIRTITGSELYAKNSNLMNSIMTMMPLWDNQDKINDTFFEKYYFATLEESKKLHEEFKFLIKESEIINKVYNKILNGKYKDYTEIHEELLSSINKKTVQIKDDGYKSFPTPMYLRTIMLDFITKNSLTTQERALYDYMNKLNNNILLRVKNFEKLLMKPLREHISNISTKYEEENAKIICVHNRHAKKGGGITRKFYLKTDPQSNNGILAVFDSVSRKELKGSIRMVGSYKFADIFNPETLEDKNKHDQIVKNMIKDKELTRKFKLKTGLNIKFDIIGHEEGAAGIYISSENETITKDKLRLITKILSEKFAEVEAKLNNDVGIAIDKRWTSEMLEIMKVMKFSTISSGHCFKPNIFIKANTLAFGTGVVLNTYDSSTISNIPKKIGWEIAPVSFEGKSIIIKSSDTDVKKDEYFKLHYMSASTFIANGKMKIDNKKIHYVNYPKTVVEQQMKIYDKQFNKNNNFTIEIDKKEFIDTNPLISDFDHLEKSLVIILNTLGKKEFCIVDTEGTGFGNYARLFNIGMTRFVLNKDKKSISILNTNILIDPKVTLGLPIESLTGITNEDIKKKAISDDLADRILKKIFRSKEVIFSAHNANYDVSIILASLPEFANLMNKNLVMDSAPIARNENLAFDERETFGSIKIKNKDMEVGSYKTFLMTNGDENGIVSFMDNPENKKSIVNMNNDIKLEWEYDTIVNKFLLIKRELSQDNKKIILGSEDNITPIYKAEYKAKKYSVVAMLQQTLTNIIREKFSTEIIPNKTFSNYITKIKFLDKEIIDILDNDNYLFAKTKSFNKKRLSKKFKVNDCIKLFDEIKIEVEKINSNVSLITGSEFINIKGSYQYLKYEEQVTIIENIIQINKMNKTATYDSRVKSIKSKFSIDLIDRRLDNFIDTFESLTKNSNKFSFSTSIKNVLENYNSTLNLDENISNIQESNSILTTEFIKDVIIKISDLNKEMGKKDGIKKVLNKFNIRNYTDLFHENHNNIEPYLSDTSLEGIAVLENLSKKYSQDSKTVADIYITEIIDTESKKILRNTRNTPKINSFSFLQLLNSDSKTKKIKKAKKSYNDLIKKNMAYIKLDLDYKLIVKFKKSYNEDELLIIGKRVEELSSIIFDYKRMINTYEKNVISIGKKMKFEDTDIHNLLTNATVRDIKNYIKDIKQLVKEKYPKSDDVINDKRVREAIFIFNDLLGFKENESKFSKISKSAENELKDICDFNIHKDPEISLKKLLNIAKNSISSIYNLHSENNFQDVNNSTKTVLSLSIKKDITSKTNPINVSSDQFAEFSKELEDYFDRMDNAFNNQDLKNGIKIIRKVVTSKEIIESLFVINNDPISFNNNMENMTKSRTLSSYEIFVKFNSESTKKLNNILNTIDNKNTSNSQISLLNSNP